jgi:hypothetical protein
LGKIIEKQSDKDYRAGDRFYRLKINLENNETKEVSAFQRKLKEEI